MSEGGERDPSHLPPAFVMLPVKDGISQSSPNMNPIQRSGSLNLPPPPKLLRRNFNEPPVIQQSSVTNIPQCLNENSKQNSSSTQTIHRSSSTTLPPPNRSSVQSVPNNLPVDSMVSNTLQQIPPHYCKISPRSQISLPSHIRHASDTSMLCNSLSRQQSFSSNNNPTISDRTLPDKRTSLPIRHYYDVMNVQISDINSSTLSIISQTIMGERQSEVNFVQRIMTIINNLKTNSPCAIIDENYLIKEYESKSVTLRCVEDPNVYNVARKGDLLHYGNLLLKVVQRLLLEGMHELEAREPYYYQSVLVKQGIINRVGQQALNDLRKVNATFQKAVMCPINSKNTIGCVDTTQQLTMVLDADTIKKGKRLVQAYKHRLLSIIQRSQSELVQALIECYVPSSYEQSLMEESSDRFSIRLKQLENMSSNCTFFKFSNLHDLHASGYALAAAFEMSSIDRKICIQELMFTQYGNMAHGFTRSTSYSVQIPINTFFDSFLYVNRFTCRSTKDRSRSGLVNPYKSTYIKNGRVIWEAIRTGSLPVILISNTIERRKATKDNAKELLLAIAANHLKRFTRTELEILTASNKGIDIPFTSLSLLTPFFLSGNEDIQTIEHHDAILDVIKNGEIDSITCQLIDGEPITVKISFNESCLLNIGVNIVMKTLMFGAGIQRAINCRRSGIRMFQMKVERCLCEINTMKKKIRSEIGEVVETLFSNHSREMSYYRNTLMSDFGRISQSQDLLDEFFTKRANERAHLNYDGFLRYQENILENKIKDCWSTDSSAMIELTYTKDIRPIVNTIHEFLEKIYKMEANDWRTRYQTLVKWEKQFVNTLTSLVTSTKNEIGLKLVHSPLFAQYCHLMNKESDIVYLFSDFEQMYFDGVHEKFSQGIIESNEINDVYSIPVRIITLSFLIGEQTHFNCKSGKDRTGELQDQCQAFAEIREQCNSYTRTENEKSEYDDHRRQVHTMIAMNGGSLEIIRQNLGIMGSKMDTCISGRFLPGFYKKYKGLSSLDTLGINGPDNWATYEAI